MHWNATVTEFAQKLEKEEGLFSVKDLCSYLLDNFDDETEVIRYLQDYLVVSEAHLQFHSKWNKIPNMENIAEYDKKEIAKVKEMIALLSDHWCKSLICYRFNEAILHIHLRLLFFRRDISFDRIEIQS